MLKLSHNLTAVRLERESEREIQREMERKGKRESKRERASMRDGQLTNKVKSREIEQGSEKFVREKF